PAGARGFPPSSPRNVARQPGRRAAGRPAADRSMNDRRRVLATMPLALLGAGGLRPFAASAADPAPPSTASRVAPLPEPVTQSVLAYYGDMSRKLVAAEASYRLAHGDGRYELGTEGKAIGVVAIFYSGVLVQQSVGRVGPAGLVPERYRERR